MEGLRAASLSTSESHANEMHEMKERAAQLEAMLKEARDETSETEQHRASLAKRLEALEALSAEAKAEADDGQYGLVAEVENAKAAAARAGQENADLEARLAEARLDLGERTKQHAIECDELKAEVARLSTALLEAKAEAGGEAYGLAAEVGRAKKSEVVDPESSDDSTLRAEVARLQEQLAAAQANAAGGDGGKANASRLAQIEEEAEAQIRASKREADEFRGRALAAEASVNEVQEAQLALVNQLQESVDARDAALRDLARAKKDLEEAQAEAQGYKQHLDHVGQQPPANNRPGLGKRLFGRS